MQSKDDKHTEALEAAAKAVLVIKDKADSLWIAEAAITAYNKVMQPNCEEWRNIALYRDALKAVQDVARVHHKSWMDKPIDAGKLYTFCETALTR